VTAARGGGDLPVNVVLFGASGMVGRGVLIECLDDPGVRRVVSVVRRPTGATHTKLTEVVHADFQDYAVIEPALREADACFFCLGVSSAGMKESDYRHITYDFTLAAARTLHRLNPKLVFIYVSGAGTDSTEKGRSMWARVKGKTENDLLALFATAYMFRPGYIHPEKGVVSRTGWVRVAGTMLRPLGAVLKHFPGIATRSDVLGRAMIAAVRSGAPSRVVDSRDINALGSVDAAASLA
jgi:uncharacterized protein YbjT (DUF2867 family)